jgi:hypothetical protein
MIPGRSIIRVTQYLEEGNLKSNCDVNLLSKLSIIFKEWRVMNNMIPLKKVVLILNILTIR